MNKKWLKGTLSALVLTLAVGTWTGCTSKESGGSGGTSADGGVTLKILHNWNGSSGSDTETNPLLDKIKAETGVTIQMDYTKGSETEKANTIFATQDLPDIYTGPAWGGELDAILKAAREDQLVDISDKLANYPNLAKSVAKENMPPALYEKTVAAFNSKQYMLYQNHPATEKDANDWLYGFYVRKDIAAQIGVDPQSVRTKEELFDFLKKIKDAGLTASGQPVYPLGGFSNGWAVGIGSTMFLGASYLDKGDGTLELDFMTKGFEDYTLYYRKLIAEGLLDPETFTQTDPIANEKIKQGRIAVLAAHYPAILDASKDYVKAHPGSDYIPIGPLERAGAEPNRPVDLNIQGNNVTVITKKCKDVDAALRLLDYMASDEGFLLARYGLEGVHWERVDGKPQAKPEWFDKFTADTTGKVRKNQGIGTGLESLTGQDRINSLGAGDIWADQDRLAAMDSARKILRPNGISIISAFSPGDIITGAPTWESLKPSLDKTNDAWKEAIFTKSDEAALKIINDLRAQIRKTGYDEAIAYMNKNLEGKEVVKLTMPN